MKTIFSSVKWSLLCSILILILGCNGTNNSQGSNNSPPSTVEVNTWSVTQKGNILEIAYGKGTDFPQYTALDLNSGYLRLIYSRDSGWGTSVILPPSFWSGGTYYQGTSITANWKPDGSDLLISFAGTMNTLNFQGEVHISPSANNSISAIVSMTTNGSATLDSRTNEAFKPVMLSSMHISSDSWDAQSAFAGAQTYQLPANGWIISPAANSTKFGVNGGSSKWKTNAPTVEITLDQSRQITGWVTNSNNPNDDNVGLWAATDTVLPHWSYAITAKAP
jgi:hypothetical protein